MPELPSVEDALRLVLACVRPSEAERRPLADALGLVLAEAVRADHDHPPFARSKVDGYAVRLADLGDGGARLGVSVRVAAGAAPGARIGPGEAARVLTGAAVPEGADAVAMQEQCDVTDDGTSVRVPRDAARAEHVVPRGSECASGEPVADAGDVITPATVGALASAGATGVLVRRRPRVRVVATGDELVAADEVPGPGKIRNSNAPALAAAAVACGADCEGTRCAGDAAEAIADAARWALDADVALLSGGVSVGDLDLVPSVLSSLGAERRLHGVRLQPGKPLWFGVRGRTLVFGLPGNPVSALVNTALFVRPALRRALGLPDGPAPFPAVLDAPVGPGAWRRRYVPASLRRDGATFHAAPVRFAGSGDVFGFSRARCLVVVPEQAPARPAGAAVECVPLFEPLP